MPIRAALFDFDGTLSLLREGWSGIMATMGVELLAAQGFVGDFAPIEDTVLRLSGKPSIFQMRVLADELARRGGTPGNPKDYLQEFLRRLRMLTAERKLAEPATMCVSGAFEFLEALQSRGVALYLASGTDLVDVRSEPAWLGMDGFFGRHVYAPADNTPHFTKADVVNAMTRDHGRIIGFGDGYSETVEVKRAGGIAIGLATNPPGVPGLHVVKRDLLRELGADAVVPDYRHAAELLTWLD